MLSSWRQIRHAVCSCLADDMSYQQVHAPYKHSHTPLSHADYNDKEGVYSRSAMCLVPTMSIATICNDFVTATVATHWSHE